MELQLLQFKSSVGCLKCVDQDMCIMYVYKNKVMYMYSATSHKLPTLEAGQKFDIL